MWIVRLALRRPYTFVVMAVLMAVLGGIAIVTMPKDIFPDIDIPIVSVVWRYGGMSPQEMSERVVKIHERTMSSTVNDIEHMESTSYTGVGVIRVFFQPKASVDLAIAQISSFSETLLRGMPPGIFPPSILKYDAASVPILQLGVSSPTLGEDKLYDYCNSFIRVQLSSVAGATMPLPYGGKPRAVMVDLDPRAMYAQHLSATDVSNAIDAQSLILPAGTAKMGNREYLVQMNSSPSTVAAMNNMPIRTVNGATVYVKDIAQVRDGFGVQTNMVRVNGTPAALITVLKNGNASTLDVVREVKAALPHALAGLPKSLKISQIFDQSIFVRAAINDVLREGLIAGVLTGLMILLFLGSWRSTLIVSISIPLSILTSLIVLNALGQTINLMTLGGMALAVGILVDDATVEIENIHRNLGMKKPITRAILDGAQQIAVPAFVSTLAICIVFVPVLLLTGVARFLFTPLAMAVVFAMLTSYLLTRTLVPTMVHYLLREEAELYQQGEDGHAAEAGGFFWRTHHLFNHGFEWMRGHYRDALVWSLDRRKTVLVLFGGFCCGSLLLLLVVGQDFFPYVDSGEMRMHVRAPEGTRIEETGRIFARIEDEIRRVIPPDEFDAVLDNIGLPSSSINLTFGDSPYIGSSDGELLISLNPNKHRPTKDYERELRQDLNAKFPDETFFFEAANMTNQILNFGLPAPIDIEVIGRNENANYQLTKRIEREVARIPGAVDVGIRQEMKAPTVQVDIDRIKASQAGLTQRDVANSLLISLSASGQVAPNQWLNPLTGVSYDISVQTPQYRINSFDTLQDTPITSAGGASTQLLRNLGTLSRTTTPAVITHYDVQPVFDIYANVDRRDLGGVARDVERVLDKYRKHLPEGTLLKIRGQVETMQSSFVRLGLGMLFAILLVYLLMVVNFQSWVDPFIILMAIPGAFSGILWMLFLTGTTLNVPSLMGCIMAIGVATANSILLVTFANDERVEGKSAIESALSAGYTRLRPVLMTALAMILGMLPMSLALGEGGEQNAPLGRAVIGGLIIATVSTLFFVPVVYSYLRKAAPVDKDRQIEAEWAEGESIPGVGEF